MVPKGPDKEPGCKPKIPVELAQGAVEKMIEAQWSRLAVSPSSFIMLRIGCP